MIFDPIPKKHKYRKRKNSKPKVIIKGYTGAAIKNISVLEDALPTNRDYRTLNRMQMKFQNWRKLEGGLDESDGEAMGRMLMANSSLMANNSNLLSKNRTKKMKERRVKHFFEEFHAMRTMKTELPFFEKMIQAVVEGENGKEEKGRRNEGKLAVLTVHDGNQMGASFLESLNNTATEEGAFASWVRKYPAMNELSTNHEFFKPFMLTIGKEIRHAATWHKLGLSIGAALMSMFDVATDVYTIAIYRGIGKYKIAELMTLFVMLSLALQLVMVAAVHHKNLRIMLIEMFGTVTFTKPAFNKFRVLTNAKMRGHAIMPPVSEMMMFKMCEVFSESIPMSVIQVVNVLESEELDLIVVGALLVSVVFVAEAVSYMTYVKDISEESRRTGKIFYGFVPLHGLRLVVVKWSMYLLSFCQLLGKSLEMAILVQIGGKILAIGVLGGELVAYLVYKLVRSDYRYWMPMPQGTSLATSLIMRVTVKVTCDFTGFLHARHPYEMGGFYWLMNMVVTQASVFGVIKLKEEFGRQIEEDVGERFVKEEDHTTIATMLFLLWFVALLGLMFGSKKEFRKTFYSTRTAKQYNKALFRSGEDEIMIQVFADHPSYYAHFEDEIKEWLGKKWNDWHASRPGWLTEELLGQIPGRLLPGGEDEGVLGEIELGEGGGEREIFLSGRKRRGSILGTI